MARVTQDDKYASPKGLSLTHTEGRDSQQKLFALIQYRLINAIETNLMRDATLMGAIEGCSAPIYESLYDAAKKYPSQKHLNEVFSKLILIGRTLGVTIERRPSNMRVADSKIVMMAAVKICDSQLQTQLRKVEMPSTIFDVDPVPLEKCHKTLEDIFIASGAKTGSELAAAYLHVHRKGSFPLVSGPARIGAKLLLESSGKSSSFVGRVCRPGTYGDWIAACKMIGGVLAGRLETKTMGFLQLNELLESQAGKELS